jgi:hypothetical protein
MPVCTHFLNPVSSRPNGLRAEREVRERIVTALIGRGLTLVAIAFVDNRHGGALVLYKAENLPNMKLRGGDTGQLESEATRFRPALIIPSKWHRI